MWLSGSKQPINPIKIDFSIYRLFDEIDFSIIKNLPGNSTVGNFGQLGQMVNSGLMVNSTKFLSRFKIDFIGIKHWGVDCFATGI